MGEIKQTNFRIDSESADLFRAYCEEQGINQAQGFDHLMHILELNKAKEEIPGRLVEIEEFEMNAKAIVSAYLRSLEIAENTEKRILEQFKARLDSKDETIADLQKKLLESKEMASEAISKASEKELELKNALLREKAALEKMDSAVAAAETKTEINNMLNNENIKLKQQLEGYDVLKSSVDDLKKQLADSKIETKEAQNEVARAYELSETKLAAKDERIYSLKEELQEAKENHKKEVDVLRSSNKEEIEDLRNTHKAELEALRTHFESIIDSLKEERAELKATLKSSSAETSKKERGKDNNPVPGQTKFEI